VKTICNEYSYFILMNVFKCDFNVKSAECAGYFLSFAILKTEKRIINNIKLYPSTSSGQTERT